MYLETMAIVPDDIPTTMGNKIIRIVPLVATDAIAILPNFPTQKRSMRVCIFCNTAFISMGIERFISARTVFPLVMVSLLYFNCTIFKWW